jgi:mannitol/fructose-specific phosphotransferase system IIA component (Ntr-type)
MPAPVHHLNSALEPNAVVVAVAMDTWHRYLDVFEEQLHFDHRLDPEYYDELVLAEQRLHSQLRAYLAIWPHAITCVHGLLLDNCSSPWSHLGRDE